MFNANQPPAGSRNGKACEILRPSKREGSHRCRFCGQLADEPERHYAIMRIECAGTWEEAPAGTVFRVGKKAPCAVEGM
jgi:hypothetical protein